MFEISKSILVRMSFDENLFMKELRKLIIRSKNEETEELKDWCFNNYGNEYGDKIINAFNTSGISQ